MKTSTSTLFYKWWDAIINEDYENVRLLFRFRCDEVTNPLWVRLDENAEPGEYSFDGLTALSYIMYASSNTTNSLKIATILAEHSKIDVNAL